MEQNIRQPKVSVVIPVYNVEPYLKQCLDSVMNQTLQELEIICVNDGSTDDSPQILEYYAKKDHRILIINQENQGLSQARNHGMDCATGEFLYFIDSDDWIDLHGLEELYQISKEKDLDVLYFAAVQEAEDGLNVNQEAFARDKILGDKVLTGVELLEFLIEKDKFHGTVWIQFYKTSFIQEHSLKFIPNVFFEDGAFTLESAIKAQRVFCLNEFFYHYRVRTTSIMGSKWVQKNIEDALILFMECMLLIKRARVSSNSLHYLRKYLMQEKILVLQAYQKVYASDQSCIADLLFNFERICFGEKIRSLRDENVIHQQRENYPQLCFFGAGEECYRALRFFKDHQMAYPVSICDNAEHKQGTSIEGIPVISFEEACVKYENISIIITNMRYYNTIKHQIEEKLGADRIVPFEI